MAQATTMTANKPAWVDLASSDAEASRNFYSKLFGWQVEVNPDPQYGGYGLAKTGGKDAAGIGPKMDPNGPTAWNLYIGTDDIEELTRKVQAAGGTAVMAPFDVGDQGRMAVYQDPAGAFISAWQGTRMGGFQTDTPNSFGWAELNARGVDKRAAVLPAGLRLDHSAERHGRRTAAVHGVPARRGQHRRRLGDESDGARRGAELLAGLLRASRTSTQPSRRRSTSARGSWWRPRNSRADTSRS